MTWELDSRRFFSGASVPAHPVLHQVATDECARVPHSWRCVPPTPRRCLVAATASVSHLLYKRDVRYAEAVVHWARVPSPPALPPCPPIRPPPVARAADSTTMVSVSALPDWPIGADGRATLQQPIHGRLGRDRTHARTSAHKDTPAYAYGPVGRDPSAAGHAPPASPFGMSARAGRGRTGHSSSGRPRNPS